VTSQEPIYEHAFLGLGCANSLIVLALHRHNLLQHKRVIVFEPDLKLQNDKTFCFWLTPLELEGYALSDLVSCSWGQVIFNGQEAQSLGDKRYYYLRSEVLYAHTRKILESYSYEWKKEAISEIPEGLAEYIFDSRTPAFVSSDNKQLLVQSFYGWVVRSKNSAFDATTFTMMDFRIAQNGQTQFMYVLPFDSHTALIEPTRFGTQIITKTEAESLIADYLKQLSTGYEVLEMESGVIPMAVVKTPKPENTNHIPTGAVVGQVKPSTGYSFERNLRDAESIALSLSEKKSPIQRRISSNRFVYYDQLLIDVLKSSPEKGKSVFWDLLTRNKAKDLLCFLDEKSHPKMEFIILSALPFGLFFQAALRDVYCRISKSSFNISAALIIAVIAIIFQEIGAIQSLNALWVLGFVIIGLPHGAIDHLHQLGPYTSIDLIKYTAKYLAIGSLMLLLWELSADFALIFFILFSAWHFGQADFEIWRPKESKMFAFLWGLFTLAFILFSHPAELQEILLTLNLSVFDPAMVQNVPFTFLLPASMVLAGFFLYIIRSWALFQSVIMLLIGTQLPLLVTFAIFFIFQHSVNGWKQLRKILYIKPFNMWVAALPFTLGGIVLMISYLYSDFQPNWGAVFIFLSALSLPHVYLMHQSYQTD
jgi:lycopene beta-cyclase